MVVEAPSQGQPIEAWLRVLLQQGVPQLLAFQYMEHEQKEAPWVEEVPCYQEASARREVEPLVKGLHWISVEAVLASLLVDPAAQEVAALAFSEPHLS